MRPWESVPAPAGGGGATAGGAGARRGEGPDVRMRRAMLGPLRGEPWGGRRGGEHGTGRRRGRDQWTGSSGGLGGDEGSAPSTTSIVGAGTAGCVLANRLSADPKASVLLLEAGGKDNWIWIHIPIGYLYTQNNPRTDWCFKTEPEPGLNGRAAQLSARPRARRLLLDQRHDLHARPGARLRPLAPAGQPRLGLGRRAALLQELRGLCRGRRRDARRRRRVARRAAAPVLGDPRCLPRRRRRGRHSRKSPTSTAATTRAAATSRSTSSSGVRWSTAKAFLRPAMRRPNLTVLTGAQATGIVFEGRRAVGPALSPGRRGESSPRPAAR